MEKNVSWVLAIVGVMIVIGLGIREWGRNQLVGHANYRFNLAVIKPSQGVSFVSFDPVEKQIITIPFPTELAITTRSNGEYGISSLYKLGSYNGNGGGMFARQKIQGFMRVPVPGYVVSERSLSRELFMSIFRKGESNLSRFDAGLLFARSLRYRGRVIDEKELFRAGVIEDNKYKAKRLQEYIGSRLFDWGIGGESVSVAIVNASGENGLGSDLAEFLSNLGLDVVMVRSVESDRQLEVSSWQVSSSLEADKLDYIFQNLFQLDTPKIEAIPAEYRANVLVMVGKDAKELF